MRHRTPHARDREQRCRLITLERRAPTLGSKPLDSIQSYTYNRVAYACVPELEIGLPACFYDHERLHQSLGSRTPAEVRRR